MRKKKVVSQETFGEHWEKFGQEGTKSIMGKLLYKAQDDL